MRFYFDIISSHNLKLDLPLLSYLFCDAINLNLFGTTGFYDLKKTKLKNLHIGLRFGGERFSARHLLSHIISVLSINKLRFLAANWVST